MLSASKSMLVPLASNHTFLKICFVTGHNLVTKRKWAWQYGTKKLPTWCPSAVFVETRGCTVQASLWSPYLKYHPIHPCGRVLPLSTEATRGKARHRVLVSWTSVVLTQLLKPRRRQQPRSRLIQMNPGLPGLFIPVGRWWLLCSTGVLICCQWSAAVLARRYQGSGIGGPMESKHRTCPLLIYPRRDGA